MRSWAAGSVALCKEAEWATAGALSGEILALCDDPPAPSNKGRLCGRANVMTEVMDGILPIEVSIVDFRCCIGLRIPILVVVVLMGKEPLPTGECLG